MQPQGFLDLSPDAHDRIERSRWFLKNITDQAAADRLQFCRAHAQRVSAVQKNLPHSIASRTWEKTANRERRHTFAGAALTHEAKSPARLNRERNIINNPDRSVIGHEFNRQILDFQ